jgi:rubredoxin
MIDPELKYCPRCNDEYRADIVLCAECRVELLSGAELLAARQRDRERKQARRGDIVGGEEMVMIHKGQLNEIKAIERELGREHIDCLIVGEGGGSCRKGCCGTSFYLQVRRQDAPDAYAVVQGYIDRTTALDDHDLSHCDTVFDPAAGQAVCPACGFAFRTSTATCPDCGLCFG